MAVNWDSETQQPWSGASLAIVPAHPVFLIGIPETPTIADDVFYQISAVEGTPVGRTFAVEKEGLILESSGIAPSEMKLITAVYPVIDGEPGTVFTLFLGGEIGQPSFTVQYSGPYTYTLGVDTKIDCLVTCRYPAYKVSTESLAPFVFEAMGFEFESIGQD